MKVYVILYTNENESAVQTYEKGYTNLEECQTAVSKLEKELFEEGDIVVNEDIEEDEEDSIDSLWSVWIETIEVEDIVTAAVSDARVETRGYDSRSTWKLIEVLRDDAMSYTKLNDWFNEHEQNITAEQIKELCLEEWGMDMLVSDLDSVNWSQVAETINEL